MLNVHDVGPNMTLRRFQAHAAELSSDAGRRQLLGVSPASVAGATPDTAGLAVLG